MKKIAVILFVLFATFACYKKSNIGEVLTTNIVDPDYNGGKWWEFLEFRYVVDPFNPDYLEARFQIKPDRFVDDASIRITVNDVTIYDFQLSTTTMIYRLNSFEEGATYCFKIGVRQSFEEVINEFEECVTYTG